MMLNKSLYRQTLVMGLFFLSGCELTQNAQRDFNRLIHGNVSTASAQISPAPQAYARPTAPRTDAKAAAKPDDTKNEGQVRALLGPPTSVEERAPGKTWHYRDGRCSVDVQLYPDVQTRQFGTLAYEVKSDDNSDEGRRDCLARFRSRAQPGSG